MIARRSRTTVTIACLLLAVVAYPSLASGPAEVTPDAVTSPDASPVTDTAGSESSDEPLHHRIDKLIEAATPDFTSLASPISSDEEFVRRLYLDLSGVIPTVDQTRSFLADDSPQKRQELIDHLLTSPQHARRLQNVFDEMLMERRGGNDVPDVEWQNWLRESFRENKPWNQLVTEILSADGVDENLRPAAKFFLDRKFDIDLITRDIGRVFLGVDLECAQCHDHPSIDGYLQRHYYGLSAFLKRSYVFNDSKSKKKVLGEKAEGDVKFTSVFTSEEGQTDPRVLDLPAIPDPEPDGDLYIAKPASKVRGVPAYSRRLQLGRAMVAEDNVDFRLNIVNRLWAIMMGRGLVEPLDLRHADNPPSHPEVLNLLADEFHQRDYDVRWLLRELALTRTYQRSSHISADLKQSTRSADAFACGLLKPLSPEQLAWSALEATGVTTVTMKKQEAALLKAEPDQAAVKTADPWWRDETIHQALKSEVDAVVARFAGQGGQKTGFEATADQALFMINGANVRKWLTFQGGALTERLRRLDSPGDLAEELYVAVLSRLPSDDESAVVTDYLEAVSDRETAIQEMTWALLTSAEFRFNH